MTCDPQLGCALRRQNISDDRTQPPTAYGGRFNVFQHAADDHGTCHFNVVDGHGGAVVRSAARGLGFTVLVVRVWDVHVLYVCFKYISSVTYSSMKIIARGLAQLDLRVACSMCHLIRVGGHGGAMVCPRSRL